MSWAAVIVLHRSRAELARLLSTLDAPQLVVVDVGPDDGGAQLAREHGAHVIERRDNPGFGAANNLALTHVTQPVTVLLNPDTIDEKRVLPELARRATRDGLAPPLPDHQPWLDQLLRFNPRRVLFAHDGSVWSPST